jgi:hypothetical protein
MSYAFKKKQHNLKTNIDICLSTPFSRGYTFLIRPDKVDTFFVHINQNLTQLDFGFSVL